MGQPPPGNLQRLQQGRRGHDTPPHESHWGCALVSRLHSQTPPRDVLRPRVAQAQGGVCVHMPVRLGREAVWAPTGYGRHTGQMHTSGVQAARSLPTGRSTPGSECAPGLGAQKTLFPRVRPPPHRSPHWPRPWKRLSAWVLPDPWWHGTGGKPTAALGPTHLLCTLGQWHFYLRWKGDPGLQSAPNCISKTVSSGPGCGSESYGFCGAAGRLRG